MQTSLIMALGGLFLVATFICVVLEQSGKAILARTLELATLLIGLVVIVSSLAKLLTEVKTVFQLY